jgi:hypothetical protein
VELALEVVVAALAAAGVLDELLEVAELPHPARMRAMPARARIDDLGTGVFSCRSVSGTKQHAFAEGVISRPRRPGGPQHTTFLMCHLH